MKKSNQMDLKRTKNVNQADPKKMKKTNKADSMDSRVHEWSFKNIMKDIELFGAEHMTWKEKKEMENRKVVSLGGKPPKKQRLPLSVARVQMKKQKEREEKMLQENMILGRFGAKFSSNSNKRSTEKRKPEDRVLKTTVGYFKNGVLDVKHMLNGSSSRSSDISNHMVDISGKKMYKGKKKGGSKKRR